MGAKTSVAFIILFSVFLEVKKNKAILPFTFTFDGFSWKLFLNCLCLWGGGCTLVFYVASYFVK